MVIRYSGSLGKQIIQGVLEKKGYNQGRKMVVVLQIWKGTSAEEAADWFGIALGQGSKTMV